MTEPRQIKKIAALLSKTPLGVIVKTPGTTLERRENGFWLRGACSNWRKVDLTEAAITYAACCEVAAIPLEKVFCSALLNISKTARTRDTVNAY